VDIAGSTSPRSGRWAIRWTISNDKSAADDGSNASCFVTKAL